MSTKNTTYKYCIVPQCKNTSFNSPNKIFLSIPRGENVRKIWCKAIQRDPNKPLSSRSQRHCCEDHFDLEKDVENFMRWKMMGGAIKLKSGVVPHIFYCQRPKTVKPKRKATAKRQCTKIVQKALNTPQSSESTSDMEWVDCGIENNPIYVDESISTCKEDFLPCKDDAYIYDETCDDKDNDTDEKFNFFVLQRNMSIEKNPKLYLGIPKDSYFCLKMLTDNVDVPKIDILITLKKIRLDEPFAILATQFGRSPRNIAQIFKRTVPKVSLYLKEFIVWPPKNKVVQCLPIAFRSKYSNIQSIIDCLEVQIQKPSNPLHQSLTWSEYKECNTIKYMISCTPDGLINFVSNGFGGRASDTAIFENCGYISNLSSGMDVMADRGFKNVSNILNRYQCTLIRPSSVSSKELLESKRIASLRINFERVIGRLRDFNMIAPHAYVDLRYLSIYDEIVIIVCGLTNIQLINF